MFHTQIFWASHTAQCFSAVAVSEQAVIALARSRRARRWDAAALRRPSACGLGVWRCFSAWERNLGFHGFTLEHCCRISW